MANGSDFIIKVTPQRLVKISGEVDAKIKTLENALRDIDQQIRNSKKYWEGDANSTHIQTYQKKVDVINPALKRFRENTNDLRSIAGVYTQAEERAKQNVGALKVDQIV